MLNDHRITYRSRAEEPQDVANSRPDMQYSRSVVGLYAIVLESLEEDYGALSAVGSLLIADMGSYVGYKSP